MLLRYILIYGVIAGAVVGVPLSVLTLTMSGQAMMHYGMLVGYLTMLIALSAAFLAIKRHRDVDLGGVIKFWPALALGLGISFVAGVIYVIAGKLMRHRARRLCQRLRPRHDCRAGGEGRLGARHWRGSRPKWSSSSSSTPTRSIAGR